MASETIANSTVPAGSNARGTDQTRHLWPTGRVGPSLALGAFAGPPAPARGAPWKRQGCPVDSARCCGAGNVPATDLAGRNHHQLSLKFFDLSEFRREGFHQAIG